MGWIKLNGTLESLESFMLSFIFLLLNAQLIPHGCVTWVALYGSFQFKNALKTMRNRNRVGSRRSYLKNRLAFCVHQMMTCS